MRLDKFLKLSRVIKRRTVANDVCQAGSVTVNGKHEVLDVKIQPEVVDPDDVEILSDMIIAATNEAMKKADDAMEQAMNAAKGSLNLPF